MNKIIVVSVSKDFLTEYSCFKDYLASINNQFEYWGYNFTGNKINFNGDDLKFILQSLDEFLCIELVKTETKLYKKNKLQPVDDDQSIIFNFN